MSTRRKKVLVLCPAPVGIAPSQRLKYEQYFGYLNRNGYDITVSSFYIRQFSKNMYASGEITVKLLAVFIGYVKRIFDLFRIPFFDGLYIHLWATPVGPPIYEHFLSLLNKNIIYDIDDMVFLDYAGHVNEIAAKIRGRKKPFVLMKNSKHVIVCTPKLEEIAKQYNNHVTDISSTINTQTYKPISEYKKNEITTLGWSGSFSTVKYLHVLDNVLKEIAKRRKIKLVVIFNIVNEEFKLEGVDVENIDWKEEQEVENLQKIEIGLYPLARDEWSLGKSSLKALQYMALGIPTIATAYGVNFRVIEHGISGLLVNTEQEWIDTVIKLIDDCDLRKKIGQRARERVERYFSVDANKDKYLDIFQSVY